ncbi:MAG: nuclear transport factor 2 family protein [Pyrinomonadaceae bacterium]|nr:nuclear transport factor 2 family protein [Pyrinomonadaceae bacterium]
MKIALWLTVCVSVVGLNTTAQQPEPAPALQVVVDTERSFARTSAERGIRESFLAYIADDGLLFRPGAVNGKKWMLEHPVPPTQKRPLLSWQPAFADIAQAGDLGYTFGPWEFKEDITDEKPVGYGHFVTVWKKQTDGSWKFAADLGISHAAPKDPKVDWQPSTNYKVKSWKATDKTDPNSTRAGLLSRERQFSKASTTDGPVKAYASYSAPDLRLFRENSYPFEGIAASTQALAAKISNGHLLTWQPLSADVSQSEDLGYTHGTYILSSKQDPGKIIERGSYVRIWKKQNGVWKLVLDVTNVWPPANQPG